MKKYSIGLLSFFLLFGISSAENTGKLVGKKVVVPTIAAPTGTAQVEITTKTVVSDGGANYVTLDPVTGFSGKGGNITELTPGNISAGSLPSNVIASSVAVNAVGQNQIADSAVTNDKLAGSIADTKLNQITTANKVATSAIAAGTLGSSVIASSVAVGAVGTDQLAGSIPDSKLAQITTADKVAAGAIAAGSLGSEVIASSLAVNAVVPENIDNTYSFTIHDLTIGGTNRILQFDDADGDHAVSFQAPETLSGDPAFILPGTVGDSGQVLTTDGTGVMSWTTPASTVKYSHFGGNNGTLGVTTKFAAMTPSDGITLTRITVTIVNDGEGGSTGSVWRCGKGTSGGEYLTVTSDASAVPGSRFTATGTISVDASTEVTCWMQSTDETITPTANVDCEYK